MGKVPRRPVHGVLLLDKPLGLSSHDALWRAKRMLRAEEKALALPVKLTVPLILFIFPCLIGVLMLPAIARIMQTMGAGQ